MSWRRTLVRQVRVLARARLSQNVSDTISLPFFIRVFAGRKTELRLGLREPGLTEFQAQALSLRPPGLGAGLGLSRGF